MVGVRDDRVVGFKLALKRREGCGRFVAARAHGMWTYEPRQGRKAATVVCSVSAVVTLALSNDKGRMKNAETKPVRRVQNVLASSCFMLHASFALVWPIKRSEERRVGKECRWKG